MAEKEQQKFLEKLQSEARLQAKLHARPFLPSQFDGMTSFIGRYPWQVLAVLSGLTAFGIEVLTRITV